MDLHVRILLQCVIERLDKIQANQEQQQRKHSELEHLIQENHHSQQRKQAQLDLVITDYIESQQRRQNQLDQVIARLDTIQNCLEIQNQKQNVLEEKLTGVTSTVEQEKVFMRDQLRDAQNEILARLSDFQEMTRTCDAKTDQLLHEIQAFRHTSGDTSRMAERLQLHGTSCRSTARTEASELTQVLREGLHSECEKITEELELSVKAVMRAELLWLGSQMDEKLSDLSTTVSGNFQEIKEELKSEISTHSQGIYTHVDSKVQECIDVGKTHADGIMNRIPVTHPMQHPRTYTFEFHLENFQDLMESCTEVVSPDWYIDEFQSSVNGYIDFSYFDVLLHFNRDPVEIPLSPWPCKKFGVMATLSDISGDLDLVELKFKMATMTWREAVEEYDVHGHHILSSDVDWVDMRGEVLKRGYGRKNAKNPNGSVVFRYELDLW